jgi:hypothetical protein
MTPAQKPDESATRLERIIALIDDLDRLKRDPKARQVAIREMKKEVEAAKHAGA